MSYFSNNFFRSVRFILVASFFALIFFSQLATAAQCEKRSSNDRASLVELYTSEGCSSCPPADKWLSKMGNKQDIDSLFIPLSFHVDYWNYIGWIDPYSQSGFTSRQKDIARRGRLSTIYTPQVVLNGKDYRAWRRQNTPVLVRAISENPPNADIHVKIANKNSSRVQLAITGKLRSTAKRSNVRMYVAVYENNLSNSVSSGENRGRRLNHDYVVRQIKPYIMPSSQDKVSIKHTVKIEPDWKRDDLGVAVFVQHQRTGKVYQALSMPLICNS